MSRKRSRCKSVVINPLTSRNKWAVRGRAIAFFLMSILFTIASFIVEAIIIGVTAVWRAVLGWNQFQKESKQKTSGTKMATTLDGSQTVKASQAESDDVVAALRSLGCSLAEARKAATYARQSLGA